MDVICPYCGCDSASHFYRQGNEIIGCEYCIIFAEPYEVLEDMEEDLPEYMEEELLEEQWLRKNR